MDYNNGQNFRRSPGDSVMMFLASIGVVTLVVFGIFVGLLISLYL
jgi:hypothetical protein